MDHSDKTIKHIPLFENDFLTVQHVPSCKAISYELKGYMQEEDARFFFEKVLYYISQTQSRNLIADLSAFKGGHMNLAKYVDQVWAKQLARAGIKMVGTRAPLSRFGAFSNKIAAGSETNSVLITKEFDSLDQAVQWIYQQEN